MPYSRLVQTNPRPAHGGVVLRPTLTAWRPPPSGPGPTPTAKWARPAEPFYCSGGVGDAVPASGGSLAGTAANHHQNIGGTKPQAASSVSSENQRRRDPSVVSVATRPVRPSSQTPHPSAAPPARPRIRPWRPCGSRPPGSRSRSRARLARLSWSPLTNFRTDLDWTRTDGVTVVVWWLDVVVDLTWCLIFVSLLERQSVCIGFICTHGLVLAAILMPGTGEMNW
jgi:hypothetical protein